MAFLDRFTMQIVVDPATGAPVEGVTADGIYDRADTGLTTPLDITDLTGIPTTLTSGPNGITPDFLCPGHTQLLVVFGDLVTPMDSLLSLLLSVLPDPSLLDDGFTLMTSSGAWTAETPTGADIRSDVTILTGTLAVYASETGTVPMRPSYVLVSVTVDRPCRLRLYDSTAHRDADVTRPRGTDPDPTADTGLMCDIAFAAAGTRTMSPSVVGSVVPYGSDVPYTVDNLDASGPAAVNLTLSYMRIEQ